MKHAIKIFSLILSIGLITFTSCEDDDPAPALTLTSLMSGTVDLNGALPATDVSVSNNIVAEFSSDVDATTATEDNITLKRGTETVPTTITVVDNTVTINPTVDLFTGTKYDLSISGVKSEKGKTVEASAISFTTAGIGLGTAPQSANQVMYLPLNGTVDDVTGNATKSSEQVAYTTDRFGVANGAANFRGASAPGNGDLVELAGNKFINSSTTFSFWVKVATADYPGSKFMFGLEANRGFFMEMGGDINWFKFATNHKIPTPTDGSTAHCYGTAWTDPNQEIPAKLAGKWAQIVMTYDAVTSVKVIYIDGVEVRNNDLDDNVSQEWHLKEFMLSDKDDGCNTFTPKDTKLAIGYAYGKNEDFWGAYSGATNTYKGLLDDFRIWNKSLTASEVLALYNSEKP